MRSPPLSNSFWIEPGRLLAGEYPGGTDQVATQARLGALIAAGVSYFIDLTQIGEMQPYDHWLPTSRDDDGRYVVYVRKSIPGRGLPPAPAAMAEILDYIERAMEVGHQVYLHCRGGVRRTDAVIGCWLRRAGLSGPDAIGRLQELRPGRVRDSDAPPSDACADLERYIQEWREPEAVEDPAFDWHATRALRERHQGCLFGLACGDALGATLQFRQVGQFAALSDLLGGGHWRLPRGAWTDDTAMVLCLAESLLAGDGFDAVDQLDRYRRWQQAGELSSTGECIGITSSAAAALRGGVSPADGSRPGGAYALSRAGAVAAFAASSPQNALAWAVAAVELTDRSPALRMATRHYTCLLLAALRGATRDSLPHEARELLLAHGVDGDAAAFGELFSDAAYAGRDGAGSIGRVGGKAWAGANGRPEDPVNALRLVCGTLRHTVDFRDGVLQIVNLGGAADVHGALFGQLAGALYGIQAIPRTWSRALLRRDLLEDLADRLLVAALTPRD